MKLTQRITALALSPALVSTAFAGIGTEKTVYVGDTITTVPTGQEGKLDLTDPQTAIYTLKGAQIRIPYAGVTSLEYGQKAGRRVGAAIATTILVSPVGLALLLSKKRKHIVTIEWTVEGHNEGAAFELGKDAIRPALTTLEARTGKKFEYESEDARKNIGR